MGIPKSSNQYALNKLPKAGNDDLATLVGGGSDRSIKVISPK